MKAAKNRHLQTGSSFPKESMGRPYIYLHVFIDFYGKCMWAKFQNLLIFHFPDWPRGILADYNLHRSWKYNPLNKTSNQGFEHFPGKYASPMNLMGLQVSRETITTQDGKPGLESQFVTHDIPNVFS